MATLPQKSTLREFLDGPEIKVSGSGKSEWRFRHTRPRRGCTLRTPGAPNPAVIVVTTARCWHLARLPGPPTVTSHEARITVADGARSGQIDVLCLLVRCGRQGESDLPRGSGKGFDIAAEGIDIAFGNGKPETSTTSRTVSRLVAAAEPIEGMLDIVTTESGPVVGDFHRSSVSRCSPTPRHFLPLVSGGWHCQPVLRITRPISLAPPLAITRSAASRRRLTSLLPANGRKVERASSAISVRVDHLWLEMTVR